MQHLIYEGRMQQFLEPFANGDGGYIDDELIERAGEEFKEALRKQFSRRENEFRLRMSNIGKSLCQLQMDQAEAERTRRPAKFLIQMLIGDAVECIMRLVIKGAGINVTSDGDRVGLEIAGATIKGDSDIDLDGDVYDIKSASDFAYDSKWSKGFDALIADDPFGYMGQLVGYSEAQGKMPGGWVVTNKSTGEFRVVPYEGSRFDTEVVLEGIAEKVTAINEGKPFERCFEAQDELYYKKPTGSKILPFACKWCDFSGACWPNQKFRQQTKFGGKGVAPYKWYAEYNDNPDK